MITLENFFEDPYAEISCFEDDELDSKFNESSKFSPFFQKLLKR